MTPVERITIEDIDAALDKLESVDVEATNLLRACANLWEFMIAKPLETRDLCAEMEREWQTQVYKLREMTIYWENIAKSGEK